MKNILFGIMLSTLALSPLSLAQTPSKPTCAEGQLIAAFNKAGEVATSDYRYYRCVLKQDQSGYLVQDFYWPSGKKQSDPLLISKDGLNEWNTDALGANGPFVIWYENGQKRYESNYVDGKETGLTTSWYENGQKKMQGQSTAGKATGRWMRWHENGKRAVEGEFIDGKGTGLWYEWYQNGQKESEGRYADWNKTGPWIHWYGNGQKAVEGSYVDGKRTGLWLYWYDSGRKMLEVQHKDGKEIILKAWDKDGKKIAVPAE